MRGTVVIRGQVMGLEFAHKFLAGQVRTVRQGFFQTGAAFFKISGLSPNSLLRDFIDALMCGAVSSNIQRMSAAATRCQVGRNTCT